MSGVTSVTGDRPALLAVSILLIELNYVLCISFKEHRKSFFYVGSTDNLERRLNEHNSRKETSTKPYGPFKMIYYEARQSKKDALIRENKLKHHGSVIGHLKRRVRHSLE